jgi:hypothetical protein
LYNWCPQRRYSKLDAVINTIKGEIPDVFRLCTVTPVIVCSKNAATSSIAKYSRDQRIAVLENANIKNYYKWEILLPT